MESRRILEITLYYDFASSLCYVGHRVMDRLSGFLDEIGCRLDWMPIDLARLMRWRRGATVDSARLEHVRQVADSLDVPLRVPGVWLDSRHVGAAALILHERDVRDGTRRAASWRERVWTAIYEEGRDCDADGELEQMASDLDISLTAAEIERGVRALELQTRAAVDAQVSGVPTFMLGQWPFGGIQDDHTMRSILGRFAEKARRRA